MKKSVLFVCSGNIFRSMSAEYLLKNFLKSDSLLSISSAGITAEPQEANSSVIDELNQKGIDISQHIQRKVNEEILKPVDLVVSMSTNHRDFLSQEFGIDSILFNQVAFDHEEPVLDINEVILDWEINVEKKNEYARAVVKYINYAIPYMVKNLNKYF